MDGSGNMLIIKGCTSIGGEGQTATVIITNLFTPNSVKTTDMFKIELYKSYD